MTRSLISSHHTGVPIKRKRDKGVRPKRRRWDHPTITPGMVDWHDWYALRVQPQKEFVTQAILKQRGGLTYVPVRKEWRFLNKFAKGRRNKTLMSYPEANGYVLLAVRHNLEPDWYALSKINTITGVVGFEGAPKRIDKERLRQLVMRFPNGVQRPEYEKHMRTGGEFKPGDIVKPIDGPYQQCQIKVVEISKLGKVPFVVEMFGKKTQAEFDVWDLELVEPVEDSCQKQKNQLSAKSG